MKTVCGLQDAEFSCKNSGLENVAHNVYGIPLQRKGGRASTRKGYTTVRNTTRPVSAGALSPRDITNTMQRILRGPIADGELASGNTVTCRDKNTLCHDLPARQNVVQDSVAIHNNMLHERHACKLPLFTILCSLFTANSANAELPENVKFCIPKQYRVTYDCGEFGGTAPDGVQIGYGQMFTTPANAACGGVHNRWRVDDSDTLITTNTTIPFSYVRDIKLTAAVDMTQDYVIDNGRLLWANPNLYLSNAESEQSYINTGVVPTMDTAIECRIMYVGASSGGSGGNPFGARDTNSVMGNGTNAFGFYCANNYLSGFNYGDNVFRKIYSNGEWRVMYLNANGAARIDDTEYNLTPVATTLTSRPMYMFSFNQAGTPQVGRMKISYCKLWHGNVLYRHWVPVYAGMQIGNTHITQNGMFDMVEQKLYPPLRGSGFTYGRD